ncbi:restriction endonuclease [Pseudomonas sp.]|uniref:restriction endonuclease n=1 Tax=Pseudomonas sp. TaxID=306 RepID=UPI003D0B1699
MEVIPAHITLPRPDEFGLPSRFDILAHEETEGRIRERLDKLASRWSIGLSLLGAVFAANVLSDHEGTPFWSNMLVAGFFSLMLSVAVKGGLERLPTFRRTDPLSSEVGAYKEALLATKRQIDDWNDRQLETGLGYWRGQRGVAFEHAVCDLLQRRGCKVTTTKGSGDGGIDLVVVVGGTTYCCQCKGHTAPVGVAPVREIAGVCSQGLGRPVLIVVNGVTKPAVATASDLGVTVIDAPQLVAMAQRTSLTGIG